MFFYIAFLLSEIFIQNFLEVIAEKIGKNKFLLEMYD